MHFIHYSFERIQKGIVKYYHILAVPHIYIKEYKRLNISPSIWQSYINASLGCLQRRKHCKAIMENLLLFTPLKKEHMTKLDLLKTSLRMELIYLQKVSVI